MPEIRLTEVRKAFQNGVVGLHPATLHIPGNSYFVLLGPSGSGKSTLLRLIAGLETPDSGSIHFDDRQVEKLPPHERGIAFMPQRSALYADRDVHGNIRAGLEFEQRRLPRKIRLSYEAIQKRVREAAERLGIGKLLANRTHELSGGEQRRVMLARALVREGKTWLLDEPLSQLDNPLAEKLSQDLHLLQRQLGHTIIHVTHDPNEAMALADRVGLLGGGRILQTGQPDEVYARPSNRTVGFYFGRPSINLIDGRSNGAEFSTRDWLRVPCPHRGDVTLGIRPEDVAFSPATEFTGVGEADVTDSRQVEGRLLVTVRGVDEFEIRGFADEAVSGRVTVHLRVNRLHWFDAQSGTRIE